MNSKVVERKGSVDSVVRFEIRFSTVEVISNIWLSSLYYSAIPELGGDCIPACGWLGVSFFFNMVTI